jgi:type IV pilus assembly protein PilP
MIRKLFSLFSVLFMVVAFVTGCSDEGGQPAPAVDAKQKVRPPKVQAEVEVKPEDAKVENTFVYDPSGKRDPFEALLAVRKPIVPDAVPLTPLQEYDLGQFRLIGAIVGKGEPRAMVEAPGGKPFMLKKGVKIGKNNGVILEITKAEVVVEEKYYDFSGAVRTNVNKIQFPPREGVK